MSVTASSVTSASALATVSDLWALSYMLSAEWSKDITVSTSWSTDVASAKTDSEHRRGLVGKPTHGITATLRGTTRAQVNGLQTLARRVGMSRFLFPLYSDQGVLVSASVGAVLTLNTKYLRLFVGGRIVVWNEQTGGFEVRIISAKTDTTLTLDTAPGVVFPAGSLVIPLIEAKLSLEVGMSFFNDSVLDLNIQTYESSGVWCLDRVAAGGVTPSEFAEYEGYPICDIPIDWSSDPEIGMKRTGSYAGTGIGQEAVVYGDRSHANYALNFSFFDRESWWKLLRLFDSRAGRLHPFWMPSPGSDYQFIEHTVNGIKVTAEGEEIDWDFRPYVAMVNGVTGEVQIRTIISHSRASGVDTLVLDSAFAPPTSIDRVCTGYLVRFDTDEMKEQWLTDTVCKVTIPVFELLEEKSVTIANLDDPTTADLRGRFEPNVDGGDSGVVVPMYYHPCSAVTERPPGRAADLRMPSFVNIRIRDEFTVDSSFVHDSGPGVSDELLREVPGGYRLDYVGDISGTSTHRHHHTVCAPVSPYLWCFTPPPVVRHLWRATKEYQDATDTTQTITVDFVAEYIEDNSTDPGAYGALFHIFVYSTEINPDYVDGTVFTPSGVTFNANDPAVWTGGALKACHPRMLICAHTPTSFYAPCGNQSGPGCPSPSIDDEDGFATCNDITENPSPWLATSDPDTATNNIVFGTTIGGVTYAGMSLGGGCPTSEIMEFALIEDQEGLTALRPERAGWDPATGDINVADGSSIIFNACLPQQTDETIDCCESNTDAPFAGSGGSPECWRSPPDSPLACRGGEDTPPPASAICCFPMTSTVKLNIRQKCISNRTIYGPEELGECTILPLCANPTVTAEKDIEYILSVCDAQYVFGGSQNSRRMEWGLKVRNPAFDFKDIEEHFDGASDATWTGAEGFWDFNSGTADGEFDFASADPDYDLIAFMTYADYLNFELQIDVLNQANCGVCFRTTGVSPIEGYLVYVDTVAKTFTLAKRVGGVLTVLDVATDVDTTAPYVISISAAGNQLTAVMNDDESGTKLTAVDCSFVDPGTIGIFADSASDTIEASFDNLNITDNNPEGFVRVRAYYDIDGWGVDVPAEAMPLYADSLEPGGACFTVIDDCGTPPDCDCTKTVKTLSPAFLAARSNESRSNYLGGGKPYPGEGGPGCGLSVRICPGGEATISVPYADWKALRLEVSSQCRVACNDDNTEDWCRGFEWYENAGCTSSP